MPHYDKAYFLEQFGQRDTEELIERALTRELTDDANLALREILHGRGIDGYALELRVQGVQKDFFRRSGVTNHCDFCGKSVVGPVRDGAQKFCGDECLRQARLIESSIGMPLDIISEHACALRVKPCPKCGRAGTVVEMRPYHLIASAILFTWYRTEHVLCCQRCGLRNNLAAALLCLVLGWWSFAGLFVTPVRIVQNLKLALRRKLQSDQPSAQLMMHARLELAETLRQVPSLDARP